MEVRTPVMWGTPLRWGKGITCISMQSYNPAIMGCTFPWLFNGRKVCNKKWQPIWWNTNLFWLGWLIHLEALTWKKLGPGKDGCSTWQTRQPPLVGQPTNHINNQNKMTHHLNRQVTPPKQATSPILGPLTLSDLLFISGGGQEVEPGE